MKAFKVVFRLEAFSFNYTSPIVYKMIEASSAAHAKFLVQQQYPYAEIYSAE